MLDAARVALLGTCMAGTAYLTSLRPMRAILTRRVATSMVFVINHRAMTAQYPGNLRNRKFSDKTGVNQVTFV